MKHKLVLITSILIFTLFAAPNTHAQWVQTNGPKGVSQCTFGVDDSILLAGNSAISPITSLKASDKIWKGSNFSLPSGQWVSAFATIGSKLLVGLSNDLTGSNGNCIYCSTDRGVNWELSSTGLTDNITQCFGVNDSFVFAGTYSSGIFRSSDSGMVWFPCNGNVLNFANVVSFVAIPGYLFAGTASGSIFRSSDNGVHWLTVDSLPPMAVNYTPSAILSVDKDSILFVTIYGQGVFYSTDKGSNWQADSNGLTSRLVTKIARCGSKLIAATNDAGIFSSSDDGVSWSSNNGNLPNIIIGDLVVIASSTIFVSTVNGIFVSYDTASSWSEIDSGLTQYFQTNVLYKEGQNLLAGTYAGVYLTTDSGLTWVQRNRGLSDVGITALTAIHPRSGTILFAGTASGPFRSTDSGNSWSLVDSGFPNFPSSSPEVRSFAAIDTILYATSWYGDLVRSTDFGTTWQILSTPVTSLFLNLISNANVLFAGGIYNLTSSVFLSQDRGLDWQLLTIALGGYDYSVNALAMDTDDLGSLRLYVDAYGDSFGGNGMSMDLGSTWEPFNAGLDSLDKESISWFDINSRFLLCGCPHGFYFSSDKRDFWTKFNQGLHDSAVYTIASTNSNIFIGTDSGVWRRPVSEMMTASSVSEKLPPKTEAFVYPNPFSQSTEITFTLQAAGYAEVFIVNMLGVEVARLFSGELGVGEHNFSWDAGKDACTTGMYECLLRMNGQVQTLPVVLMR
jgi:photosystem II stability/assembly factor-like uncharacterized protein